MKTPDEWHAIYARQGDFVGTNLIAEIQRDARDGMVPWEDVRPLTQSLSHGSKSFALEAFRAKHPELFPK